MARVAKVSLGHQGEAKVTAGQPWVRLGVTRCTRGDQPKKTGSRTEVARDGV